MRVIYIFLASLLAPLFISCDSDGADDTTEPQGFNCNTIIEVTTQAEVDALGSQNCDFILGLRIGSLTSSNTIFNLNSLSSLNRVGVLMIYNTALTDLNGLEQLTEITGTSSNQGILDIRGNTALTSINALNALEEADVITITDNDNLQSVNGFNNLIRVYNGLSITNNDALTSISGLNTLKEAYGGLFIRNNTALNAITGFSDLAIIDAGAAPNGTTQGNDFGVSIANNTSLSNLCGLTGLVQRDADANVYGEIDGLFTVTGNAFNPTQQDILNGNCSN